MQGKVAFKDSITVKQNIPSGINQVIDVRLKATDTTGIINGLIQNVVAGVTKFVNVNGSVLTPTLSTTVSSLSFTTVKNRHPLLNPIKWYHQSCRESYSSYYRFYRI